MSDDRFAQSSDAAPDDVSIPDPDDPQSAGLAPPAPVIDLGGAPSTGASRPLGPRRLALLQEQMAEHQKEIAEKSSDDPSRVDPELAQKQRRMAELASRAAIASDEDRQLAEDAIAQTQSIPPITDEHLAARDAEPSTDEPASEEPVVEGPVREDDVASDEPEQRDATPVVEQADDADERSPEEIAPVESAEDEQEPSSPVRAVNAQGLQLMEPKDYRSSPDWRTPALSIAAILILALAVVLLLVLL